MQNPGETSSSSTLMANGNPKLEKGSKENNKKMSSELQFRGGFNIGPINTKLQSDTPSANPIPIVQHQQRPHNQRPQFQNPRPPRAQQQGHQSQQRPQLQNHRLNGPSLLQRPQQVPPAGPRSQNLPPQSQVAYPPRPRASQPQQQGQQGTRPQQYHPQHQQQPPFHQQARPRHPTPGPPMPRAVINHSQGPRNSAPPQQSVVYYHSVFGQDYCERMLNIQYQNGQPVERNQRNVPPLFPQGLPPPSNQRNNETPNRKVNNNNNNSSPSSRNSVSSQQDIPQQKRGGKFRNKGGRGSGHNMVQDNTRYPVSDSRVSREELDIYNRPPARFLQLFYSMVDDPYSSRRGPICEKFKSLSLNDQFEEFLTALSLTELAQRQRERLLLDLRIVLQREFPNCLVYAFGSFLTGLNDITSDLDVYVDAFGSTKGLPIPTHESSTIDVLMKCQRIVRRAKCVQSNKPFCCQVIPIKEARVPILKLRHSLTSINCDLSFENLISVRNSELIRLYTELHPVVRPLLVFIRYWGKFHNLTGSNSIKNYGLILIILVFLAKKGIVPSIATLQKTREVQRQRSIRQNDEPDNAGIIDGWDTSFYDNVASIRLNQGTSLPIEECEKDIVANVLKLAQEFFEMYAEVDFSTLVVCSYTAELLPKSRFAAGNEEDLPELLDRYKEWSVKQPSDRRLNIKSSLCIQDPFVLSYNVGSVTPGAVLLKFQVACSQTKKILAEKKLTCILDAFQPLPKEVGDRNFMNMQERQKRTKDLQREIIQYIEHGTMYVPSDDESPESVAMHLKPIAEIIDKNSVRFGKGWESFSKFEPDREFQSLFVDAVKRSKFNRLRMPTQCFNSLKLLWVQFTQDFLNQFWEKCFDFKVTREEKILEERSFADGLFSVKTRKNYEAMFADRSKSKRGSNSSNNSGSTTDLSPQAERIQKKLIELGDLHEHISYQRIKCKVYEPVWQKRERTFNQIMTNALKEKPKEDAENLPKLGKKKSKKKAKAMLGQLQGNVDPLDIEQQITNVLLESFQTERTEPPVQGKQNPLLTFVSYIKIDCSLVDDLPSIHFVFDRVDGKTAMYNQGVSVVVETISGILSDYYMYRLKKWLDVSERDEGNESTTMPLDADNTRDVELSFTLNNSLDDSDLLLPPSSTSSECCSPVPDNNNLLEED